MQLHSILIKHKELIAIGESAESSLCFYETWHVYFSTICILAYDSLDMGNNGMFVSAPFL